MCSRWFLCVFVLECVSMGWSLIFIKTQLLSFGTGKARKGNSNYESNDIADDDPENAKGEFYFLLLLHSSSSTSHLPIATSSSISVSSAEQWFRFNWNSIWLASIIWSICCYSMNAVIWTLGLFSASNSIRFISFSLYITNL